MVVNPEPAVLQGEWEPTQSELNATTMLALYMEEVSAKVRFRIWVQYHGGARGHKIIRIRGHRPPVTGHSKHASNGSLATARSPCQAFATKQQGIATETHGRH